MLRKFLYRFGFVPYKDYDDLMGRYLRLSTQYIAVKQEAADLAREIHHAETHGRVVLPPKGEAGD